MPSCYSSSAVIVKIDPKSGSEGVIESEQRLVISKLSVLHANGGSFTHTRLNLHMNAAFCFLLLQLLTQERSFLQCLRARSLNVAFPSVESADEEVPPHCPDPHVTSVSLCPASLRAYWLDSGREKSVHRGSFFILMSHSTEQEQEEE